MSETPTIGDVIAERYEVLGLVEEAPAYTAFRVRDRDVEVDVALFWIKEALFPTESKRDAFVGAVVDVRGLVHPHLRRIFEAGRPSGGLYLTAQLGSHEGPLLRLGSGHRPPEFEVLRYATALVEALEAAHELGHVHGLLIPSDLVQVAGQIKLGGIGLYRDADPPGIRSCFGEVRRYLAPEVFETGLAIPASDVYSVAAILSELASGVSDKELAEATEALAAANQLKLADVLAQALSVTPERRPKRPRDLLDRIRLVLVDDRVPTAEQPAEMPPADVDADLDAPTVRDLDPVSDQLPTTAYQKIAPPADEKQDSSTDSTRVATDVSGRALALKSSSKPSAEPVEPPTERDGRRARETFKLFGAQGSGAASKQTETVVQKSGRMRAAETIPDELPPPPTPPPSSDSASAPAHLRDLDSTSSSSAASAAAVAAQVPSGPAGGEGSGAARKPAFVSMKPADDPNEPRPRPIAAIERPEMQPKLRPLGSVRKSVPPGSLGRYAPPRQPSEARESPGDSNLARRLWMLVGIVALVVAAAVLATWLLVRGGEGEGEGEGIGEGVGIGEKERVGEVRSEGEWRVAVERASR